MSKLLALHNITETKLKGVLELGAFPMPSLAITMAEFPHQSFGDITFVFKKSTVDPRASRCNDLYEADAYTCRFPDILYEFDEKTIGEGLEKHITFQHPRRDFTILMQMFGMTWRNQLMLSVRL